MKSKIAIHSAATTASLAAAVRAARAAGGLIRANWHLPKKINVATAHDIKLELDVRCQKTVERTLRAAFPRIPVPGEEGVLGNPEESLRWVVDPIDGTVNFSHGIPHACVSIALQQRVAANSRDDARLFDGFQTIVGVVYDPFCDEIWTAIRGQKASLNGRIIRVSSRAKMSECLISLGFAKNRKTLGKMLPVFNRLVHRVRKIRMMGAAALAITYVASGRFDAYLEYGLRLWDIAAGGLIVECAGGEFWWRKLPGKWTYEIVANNGKLQKSLLPLRSL